MCLYVYVLCGVCMITIVCVFVCACVYVFIRAYVCDCITTCVRIGDCVRANVCAHAYVFIVSCMHELSLCVEHHICARVCALVYDICLNIIIVLLVLACL